jgi:membrane associated rhomboid family serine protease
MTIAPVPQRPVMTVRGAGLVMGALLVLLWVLEGVDQLTLNALDGLGVSPREVDELPQVFTAPFLHFGFEHLASNSLPFLVLGLLVLLSGLRNFVVATLASIVVSGLVVWLVSAPGTVTAGASGLVFGWLAYLLVRGFFTRDWKQILIAVVVFVVYGGILWGVLPGQPGVSWEGHLGGAAGGVLAAWWLHRTPARTTPRVPSLR